jgi:hypothetical protein
MQEQIEEHVAVIVPFYSYGGSQLLPSEDELKQQLPLRIIASTSDGVIYSASKGDQ